MQAFQPQDYPPAVAELLQEKRLAPLGPGRPNEAVRARLQGLTVAAALAPHPVRDEDMARACLAGLWLYHDFLDQSHTISQEISTSTGSYWHGLMHRREPDYGNAAYWFRRVGRHPVFDPLHEAAVDLAGSQAGDPTVSFLARQSSWDPFRFIDLCAAAQGSGSATEMLCREIQLREWELLFDWCFRRAT